MLNVIKEKSKKFGNLDPQDSVKFKGQVCAHDTPKFEEVLASSETSDDNTLCSS